MILCIILLDWEISHQRAAGERWAGVASLCWASTCPLASTWWPNSRVSLTEAVIRLSFLTASFQYSYSKLPGQCQPTGIRFPLLPQSPVMLQHVDSLKETLWPAAVTCSLSSDCGQSGQMCHRGKCVVRPMLATLSSIRPRGQIVTFNANFPSVRKMCICIVKCKLNQFFF